MASFQGSATLQQLGQRFRYAGIFRRMVLSIVRKNIVCGGINGKKSLTIIPKESKAASVAAAIYLLRTGKDKNEVRSYIEDTFHYHFQQTLDEIRLDYQYNASCQETVPQAMTAFGRAMDLKTASAKPFRWAEIATLLLPLPGALPKLITESLML